MSTLFSIATVINTIKRNDSNSVDSNSHIPRFSTAYILLGGVYLNTLVAITPRRSGSVWTRVLVDQNEEGFELATMATQNTSTQTVQLFSRQITDKRLQSAYYEYVHL